MSDLCVMGSFSLFRRLSTLNKCAVMRIGTPANKHVSIRDSVADSEGGGSTLDKCAVMRIGTPANKHVSNRDSVADSGGRGARWTNAL